MDPKIMIAGVVVVIVIIAAVMMVGDGGGGAPPATKTSDTSGSDSDTSGTTPGPSAPTGGNLIDMCKASDLNIEDCLGKEAAKANDMSICDLAAEYYGGGDFFRSNVDTCLIAAAVEMKDVNVCKNVIDDSLFESCAIQVAEATLDPSVCGILNERGSDMISTCEHAAEGE